MKENIIGNKIGKKSNKNEFTRQKQNGQNKAEEMKKEMK